MKNITFILSVILIMVGLSASGETYTVDVGQFDKMKVNGNLRVVYKHLSDSTGFARYEAPAGNEGLFDLSVKKDGLLKIQPSDNDWNEEDLPILYLYSDFLTSVESFSEKDINISDLEPCASLSVTLVGNGSIYVEDIKSNNVSAGISTGNGSIYLEGSCINASFRMVGTGLISADQLQAENVKCRILGTGSIGCWPIDNLNVAGLGSTKIYYKGKPNIKKTGGGKLFELPDEGIRKEGTEVHSF